MWRVLAFCLLTLELSAQLFNAAPYFSMGNTGIAQRSAFNLFNNPAGLATENNISAGTFYQWPNLSSDQRIYGLFAATPLGRVGVVGAHYTQSVIDQAIDFKSTNISYAKAIIPSLLFGVGINLHRYALKDIASSNSYSLDVGLQYIFKDVTVALSAKNISNSFLNKDFEIRNIRDVALGAHYRISNQVGWSAEINYDFADRPVIKSGVSYQMLEWMVIRAGVADQPLQFYGGMGANYRSLHLELASAFHDKLGPTPQMCLSYAF